MGKRFSIADYVEARESAPMEITMIPIREIETNWRNFYGTDSQEQDLAESIKISGLLTPLGVIEDGSKYKLISGHRRLRALRYLRDSEPDGRTRWDRIPCVIYASPEDADREELMLIHANAQRIKSGPELAQEAKKTTEILVRLKERGVDLPGRMRNRVAEALKISSTRLARIEAIEHNLTYPGWARKWKENLIPEAVAYRLSQLDYDQQMSAADYVINKGLKNSEITVAIIEEALRHPPLDSPGTMDPLAYETDVVKVDRELTRRADFAGRVRRKGLQFANRKDGMDQLKKAFAGSGSNSDGVMWAADSKGVRFSRPVDHLLGWGAMYDALAANALNEAVSKSDHAAETQQITGDEGLAFRETTLQEAPVPVWQTGTPESPGRYLVVIRNGDVFHEYTAEWTGEQWLVFDRPMFAWMEVAAWWPLPQAYREAER